MNRFTQQIKNNKNWVIRSFALLTTILCVFNLKEVGYPKTELEAITNGTILSITLNTPLWLASFKWVRVKLKYIITLLILLSNLGIFISIPWDCYLNILFVGLHFWFVYFLIRSKEVL